MKIIDLLDTSDIIQDYEVMAFREWDTGVYYKIQANIINNTQIHIREYIDEKDRKYSYHWQDKEGNLIIRWDNAPYHKEIRTYPHHKHIHSKITESKQVAASDILDFIKSEINKNQQ